MFLTPGPAPFLVNVLKTHGHHGSQQQSILCHTITHTKQLTQLLTSSAALLAACHSGLLPGASTAAPLCSGKSPDHFTFKAWACSGASTVASTGQWLPSSICSAQPTCRRRQDSAKENPVGLFWITETRAGR